ncbi:MAG: LysR family transcriptional regulator [Rhodobacteraceae bacterium]|nr:LysR family transcriptional regulator [Paracoccaceae bacterium]
MGQIEDLRLFALVVENRGISRAADKLHIAKSAVSRRLNLLEERFGARLIDRKPGVWEVTTTGRELYQRAVRVVSDVEEIESDFRETAQNLAGPLTISVPRDFGIAYLKPALTAFKERHPEIQLTVDFDDRAVDLTRENYDFAIRITALPQGNVVAKKIGSTRHQLCASPAYLTTHGEPTCLDDLNDHPLLNFGTARRTRWDFVGETGKPETFEFQPALNSNSGAFLLDAALAGLGFARLPDFIAASAIASGELVPILQSLAVPDWGIYLVHAEDRRLNRRMRLFSEEMIIACSLSGAPIG